MLWQSGLIRDGRLVFYRLNQLCREAVAPRLVLAVRCRSRFLRRRPPSLPNTPMAIWDVRWGSRSHAWLLVRLHPSPAWATGKRRR